MAVWAQQSLSRSRNGSGDRLGSFGKMVWLGLRFYMLFLEILFWKNMWVNLASDVELLIGN